MINLVIKDTRNNEEKIFAIENPPIILGRAANCTVPLMDNDISRRHCEIGISDGKIYVKDLNSTNFTFLNDKKIEPEKKVFFEKGDVIKIGSFLITLKDEEKPKPPKEEATPTPERIEKEEEMLFLLKKKISSALVERLNLRRMDLAEMEEEEFRKKVEGTVIQILKEKELEIPIGIPKDILVKELLYDILGLGPLEEFIADDTITEIMVNAPNQIYVERAGKLYLTNKRFFDEEHIMTIIQRIIQPLGRRIDESSPYVDARLKDGSRVHAIIPPLAIKSPTLTIRKFAKKKLTANDLINFGALNQKMVEFLQTAVKYRANILVSGGTGSGKTTLLNVLSNFIPDDERIITVEDSAELKLNKEHVISLEARPPNIEGKGEVSIRDLVRNTLRMRPDRIVVGECRGGEALDMLQAMNTGHDGSLTTIHANSPRDTLKRLETLVMMAGMDLPSRAIREQIASAIDFIVQTARLADGSRKVTHITEITGMEGDVITTQDIFIFKQEGFETGGKIKGYFKATGNIPKFFEELKERGIKVNLELFKDKENE
ncbi:MAG: ATPase, T2SS/T4P/T4SS family [candidate division WOR-3 bacterium]